MKNPLTQFASWLRAGLDVPVHTTAPAADGTYYPSRAARHADLNVKRLRRNRAAAKAARRSRRINRLVRS